jgi:uncharacterized membrane protein
MPSSKWLITALVISLVANLVLAGVLLGRTTSSVTPARIGPDPAAMYFRMLGFLPDERREALMPIVRGHLSEVRPEVRETRHHLRGMFEALTSEPFDAERLETKLAELRRVHAITQQKSHRSFVELASAMSHEEREAMADALRRPPPRLERNGFGRGSERTDRAERSGSEGTTP